MEDDVGAAAREIKSERARVGWSVDELAKRARALAQADGNQIKLSQQLISAFENGKAQKLPHWLKYARLAFAGSNASGQKAVQSVSGTSENSISIRQLDLRLSMGPGSNLDDYIEEGTFDFDAAALRSITRSPADRLFVAAGDGESMYPTIQNNDTVLVDMLQTQLNLQDRIWACSIFGAGAIKRLRAAADRKVLVMSDNPTVPAQEVSAEDLRIMGRVVWIGRRV